MKVLFNLLGLIVLLIILAFGYTEYLRSQLAPSASAYADESIRAIITTWSEDEAIKRLSPELSAVTPKAQLGQYLATLNDKLGTLQSYGGSKGGVGIKFSVEDGTVITALYVANATFQYGNANILIRLIRHGDAWQILSFHVTLGTGISGVSADHGTVDVNHPFLGDSALHGTTDTNFAKDWVILDGKKIEGITSADPAPNGQVAILYSDGVKHVPASSLPQGFLDAWELTPDRFKTAANQ
jgi:hypothetical protein